MLSTTNDLVLSFRLLIHVFISIEKENQHNQMLRIHYLVMQEQKVRVNERAVN